MKAITPILICLGMVGAAISGNWAAVGALSMVLSSYVFVIGAFAKKEVHYFPPPQPIQKQPKRSEPPKWVH